jgi:hypothetical protein
MAIFSIIKSIADLIAENKRRNFGAVLTKVRSHTGLLDPNSVMNNHANVEANKGRIESLNAGSIPILIECYQNLSSAWLELTGGIIMETKSHAAALEAQNEFCMREAIGKAKPGQHINF